MSNHFHSDPDTGKSNAAVNDALQEVEHQLSMLWRRARSMSHQLSRQVHPDVEPAAYGLMTFIRQEGDIRLTDLAAIVGITKSSASRQIALLQSLGLVEKKADAADGRAQYIGLTERGEERMHEVQNARSNELLARFAEWPQQEVQTLAGYLNRLNAMHMDKLSSEKYRCNDQSRESVPAGG
ncbi:MarR family winged helix-turn-helix transcriptional regulator [Pseudarthrobacter sp. fls2-241-R2A-127]|uniref:MarR family winged helix-turn-helix transcriptional regulator n=1 Tax=Pseudarthrobacter sp. fls2-241-R2A-127 TaxID=3040303 RepID=UPI0025528636|nr:MarR family winged helix-turn-helix transcriptional regulator [Pseudarthrobacter sp. fls2-241-R2A-127]